MTTNNYSTLARVWRGFKLIMPIIFTAISIALLGFWTQYLIKSTEPTAESWMVNVAWLCFGLFFIFLALAIYFQRKQDGVVKSKRTHS